MFKNHLTIALRSLRKQGGFAFINIVGLAIGLTCFILIGLFVQFELSYDSFHEKSDRIYRIVQEQPGEFYLGSNRFAVTPAPLRTAVLEEIPEVEHAAQIDPTQLSMRFGEKQFNEEGIYASEGFLDVFSFRVLQGDAKEALARPDRILLTESLALRYFGKQNPVGKSLTATIESNQVELTVAGTIEDVPPNSHLTFDFVVSMATSPRYQRDIDWWLNNNYLIYVSLRADHDPADFDAKVAALPEKHLGQTEYYQNNPEQLSKYYIQALRDIHLRSHINAELGQNGDVKYIYLFSAIALLIVLIACINYVNLATARSATRAMEVGVRKVMGANRGQLIAQFIGEAIVPAVIALGIALALAAVLLPVFRSLTDREIFFDIVENGRLFAIFVVAGLGIGMLAGSYPAFMLTSFHPVHVMKGGWHNVRGKALLRNLLVVLQFSITIALIVGALVIHEQLAFVRDADTGVRRNHVISIDTHDPSLSNRYEALKQTLEAHSGIERVTASFFDPIRISSQSTTTEWDGVEEGQSIGIYHTPIRDDFLQVFDIELIEGQGFFRGPDSDGITDMVINETLKKRLGWESAIGKRVFLNGRNGRVIGVMNDFNFQSFRHTMEPLALYVETGDFSKVQVRIRPDHEQEAIAFLENTFAAFSPGFPFQYQFVDDAYNRLYQTEIRLGSLFSSFTILALCIACLGLLGLTTFTAEQRTKEIGVRKVLGATIADILVLLSIDFTRLILLAFVISVPIAYLAMNRWLQEFAYRVPLEWSTFAMAGGAAFILAWLTIGYQSMKAALANPVRSLRYE